ncbi:hypothetical protein LCGC14_0893650 [marine sediment metagenome]|uniref:Uncharacterized protein n=1 Tax=marine sediment metagenome TaxID=412755 RepID=A0A0F9RHR9_9ZZZZ
MPIVKVTILKFIIRKLPIQTKKKRKLSNHPYDEFGLKPKKVFLNKLYLYHAVCPERYKKESNGINPPVFVATQPKAAIGIVKMVHGCKNPIVLKINIKGLPIYKDLYWEYDDKQYRDEYSMFSEPFFEFVKRDMSLPLRKITENNIYYIPKRVVRERIIPFKKPNFKEQVYKIYKKHTTMKGESMFIDTLEKELNDPDTFNKLWDLSIHGHANMHLIVGRNTGKHKIYIKHNRKYTKFYFNENILII